MTEEINITENLDRNSEEEEILIVEETQTTEGLSKKVYMIEYLKKFAPVGGVLIIFFSAIKHVVFYQAFNIAIIYYLTITEFILLLLNDIILFSVSGTLIALIFYGPFTRREKQNVIKSKKIKNKNLMMWFLLVMVALSGASFFMYPFDLTDNFKAKFSLVILVIYIIYFLYITSSQEVTITFISIFLISFLVVLMTASAYNNVLRLKGGDKERTLEYSFILKDEKIVTEENYVFIGKTEKYIFLYNRLSKVTRVLSTENLKEMSIRELK